MKQLVFSSKAWNNRRDSIRKYTPVVDKRRELALVGRVGYFEEVLSKDEEGNLMKILTYEPSYVYKLYIRDLKLSEEKIKQRQLSITS